MKKARWYTLGFLLAGVNYSLFLDNKLFKKEYNKIAKDFGFIGDVPKFILSDDASATIHSLTTKLGDITALVCMKIDKEKSDAQIISLLVHEVVHVWQQIKEVAGIFNPNKEFEAETIQQITQDLLSELLIALEKRKKD